MEDLSTESKVAITVIGATVIIILAALYFTGSFPKIFDNYKKNTIIKCTKLNMQSVIDYKEISCVATDEDGKSYTMTYPEFKDESFAIKTLNKELKSKYEEASKKIEYHEDEELNKLKIYSINEISYKITSFNNYLFVIDISNILLDNGYRYDYIYNVNIIDLNNKTRVSQQDFFRTLNLTNSFSSNLRRTVMDIYQKKFNYSYEFATDRNNELDDFYQGLSSSNINTYYYDASGRLSFILYMYDVKQFKKVPYFFKVGSDGSVSYSEIFS